MPRSHSEGCRCGFAIDKHLVILQLLDVNRCLSVAVGAYAKLEHSKCLHAIYHLKFSTIFECCYHLLLGKCTCSVVAKN